MTPSNELSSLARFEEVTMVTPEEERASEWIGRNATFLCGAIKKASKLRLVLGVIVLLSSIILFVGIVGKDSTYNAQALKYIGGFGLACSLAAIAGSYVSWS